MASMEQGLLSRIFLFLIGFLTVTITLQAQVLTRRSATGVTIDKSGITGVDANIPLLTLPTVDTDPLLKEDELATKMGHPFRFGTSLATDVHITQAGRLIQNNGYRVFQYRLLAPGAYSLKWLDNENYVVRRILVPNSATHRVTIPVSLSHQKTPLL